MSNFPFDHFLKNPTAVANTVEKNESSNTTAGNLPKYDELKEEIITYLKNYIDPSKIETYFSSGFNITEIKGNVAEIEVQSNFLKKIIESHYQQQISDAFLNILGKKFDLSVSIKKPDSVQEKPSSSSNEVFFESKDDLINRVNSKMITHLEAGNNFKTIDTKKTFSNFIVGPSNNMAHAAAMAAAKNPGKVYPSLYIHGGSGLGKTHLVCSVANYISEKFPTLRIAFVTTNDFMNDMVNFIKENKFDEFIKKYTENLDVLLIDDIHELKNRQGTQNQFFYIFNELYNRKKQLIFTSDKHPKEIDGIEERIKTRLTWGLVVEIHQPDLETRIAILKKKANEIDIFLPDDVVNLIASSIKSNIRELEGSLIKLGAYSSLFKVDIDLEIAKQQLRLDEDSSAKITCDTVCKAVAQHYKIPISDIKGKSRIKEVATARHVAMYLCHHLIKITLTDIGEIFGNRDHTTVLHAVNKIKHEIKQEGPISKTVFQIENNL